MPCAVKAFISLILAGRVKDLIADWRLLADTGTLSDKQQKLLKTVCRYFENNLHRMRYDHI